MEQQQQQQATSTDAPLTKAQKQRLKEKERKARQKQEEAAFEAAEALLSEDEKFKRKIEWCIYQLQLGQQRKDSTKDQIAESESVIKKLRSTKNSDIQKEALMFSVFGKDIKKLMRTMPMPDKVETTTTATEAAAEEATTTTSQ
ncbi:hypothetical protein CYY_008211 [Polysphondylium violaceum]|uniref:Uncharacterized protein n=1 Tax=Polysphondylium violaceum TaxID=133409 RepID=A0A8J4UX49_9MYCE|nr:hypothetical protein CYY_008211 [Polysphondylium violaceum]